MLALKYLFIASVVSAAVFSLSGCESAEENDVAEAQQCLNNLTDSAPYTAADACEQKISGIYSSEAYVIRCSVDFIDAGITPTALLNAYQSSQNQTGGSATATLMAALTQNTPGTTTPSTTQANLTYSDCQASGVESLIFLAGVSQTGTLMAVGAGSTDPATMVSQCNSNPSACNPTAVGTTAQSIYGSYCQGSNSSSSTCTLLNSAISQGNGNPTTIGQNIFNLLGQN